MDDKAIMKEQVKEIVIGLGADVCGVARAEDFTAAPEGFRPRDIMLSCRSVVVFGIAIPKGLLMVKPDVIYQHFNYHTPKELDRIAYAAALTIERRLGAPSVPLPSDGPYEYWDEDKLEGRGLISMKHAAVIAGLGTLGKNTLLMNKRYGNRLNIGALLTELELMPDEAAEPVCLAGCRRCIAECPSGALNGRCADQKKCRPAAYGVNARGFDTVLCNRCRSICPMAMGTD